MSATRSTLQLWKRTVLANVRRMTKAQAVAWLARYHAESIANKGATIFHQSVRELTGGYNSQSINFWTVRTVFAKTKQEVQP